MVGSLVGSCTPMAPMYISSPRWCTSPLTSFDQWCVVSVLGAAQVHLSWPVNLEPIRCEFMALPTVYEMACFLWVWLPLWKSCNHAALSSSPCRMCSVPRLSSSTEWWTFQLVTSLVMHSAHCAQDRGVPQVLFLVCVERPLLCNDRCRG